MGRRETKIPRILLRGKTLITEEKMSQDKAPLRCVVLGCGVVGTEVVRRLLDHGTDLQARSGVEIELVGIGVRSLDSPRDPVVPTHLLTQDLEGLVDSADIVVELMGGVEPAKSLILRALNAGASVVSANKELLAQAGPELQQAADLNSGSLLYEAAVAGAVPVVRGIRESLAGDRITKVLGIVNGTTNYILDQMTTTGADFNEALEEAQRLGYAEADPTADVDGLDAGAKAAILASLAFHTRVYASDVPTEGIRGITAEDIQAAQATGSVVKLLAIAESDNGALAVRVHPALVPLDHPLAAVSDAYNPVFIEAEAAGTLMFYGPGAGGAPTAGVVLGDIVDVARGVVTGGRAPAGSTYADLPIIDPGLVPSRYHFRLTVADRHGVLSEISSIFAHHGVSIETVHQTPGEGGNAGLIMVTYRARQDAIDDILVEMERVDSVVEVISVLRVEGN